MTWWWASPRWETRELKRLQGELSEFGGDVSGPLPDGNTRALRRFVSRSPRRPLSVRLRIARWLRSVSVPPPTPRRLRRAGSCIRPGGCGRAGPASSTASSTERNRASGRRTTPRAAAARWCARTKAESCRSRVSDARRCGSRLLHGLGRLTGPVALERRRSRCRKGLGGQAAENGVGPAGVRADRPEELETSAGGRRIHPGRRRCADRCQDAVP